MEVNNNMEQILKIAKYYKSFCFPMLMKTVMKKKS